MIDTHEKLEAYIRLRLSEQESCRVFEEMLAHCWSLPKREQEREIAAFADEHGWAVKVYRPGNCGRVADFRARQEP